MTLNSKNNPWESKNLQEVFKIMTGTTPSTKSKKFWSNGTIVWVTPSDMSLLNGKIFISDSERKITKAALDESNLVLLPTDSIIISTRAPVGYVAINKRELCFNQGCKALVKKEKYTADSQFYYYYFSFISNYLNSISGGSTFKELSKDALKNLDIPFPPLSEQKAIADILSTVDEAIQKADEAIKKSERIKQGMMHKLLTEGIGHKEFKQTKIGKIPKAWEVKKVGEVAKIRSFSNRNSADLIANIPMELISDSKLYCKFLMKAKQEIKSFTYCESGDLLFAKITPSLENGKQGIVPDNIPNGFAYATTEVFPLVANSIDNKFLFYLLKLSRYRNIIIGSMIGTTGRQRASKQSLEKLRIPLPGLDEQSEIVEILETFDSRIDLSKQRKQKLERIKTGLMNDLLTGKKRVKIN